MVGAGGGEGSGPRPTVVHSVGRDWASQRIRQPTEPAQPAGAPSTGPKEDPPRTSARTGVGRAEAGLGNASRGLTRPTSERYGRNGVDGSDGSTCRGTVAKGGRPGYTSLRLD